MSKEIDPLALAPVTVRRCDIERLKRKIAKLRHDRDEWRKRAETAERLIMDTSSAHWRSLREQAFARSESEVKMLKTFIADRVIEKLKVKP